MHNMWAFLCTNFSTWGRGFFKDLTYNMGAFLSDNLMLNMGGLIG